MKRLYDVIDEALSQEWREKLQALIDSDAIDDKTAKKMLGIAKSMSAEDTTILKSFFVSRGIEDDMRNLVRILKDYDVMEEIYDIAKEAADNTKPSRLPSSSDFVKSDNVYDLFGKISPSFTKDLLMELSNEKPSRNSITRGMFEIVCQMFLSDICDRNSSAGIVGHGDINTKNEDALEFKTPGARVKSQKEHPATLIDDYIDGQLRNCYKVNGRVVVKDVMKSQDSIIKFMSSVNALGDEFSFGTLSEDEWFDLFTGALFAQYGVSDWKSRIQYDVIKKDVLSNFKNPKLFAKSLIRLMGCIQLGLYQEDEKWSHMILFKGKNGAEALNRGDYACISAEYARDITKVYFDKHFEFTGGGNGHGTVRDHYCSIKYI